MQPACPVYRCWRQMWPPALAHLARVLMQQLQGGSSGPASPRNQSQSNPPNRPRLSCPSCPICAIALTARFRCFSRVLQRLTAVVRSWRSSSTGEEQRKQGVNFRLRQRKEHIVSCRAAWIGSLQLAVCIDWGVRPRVLIAIPLMLSPISTAAPMSFRVWCIFMLHVRYQHLSFPICFSVAFAAAAFDDSGTWPSLMLLQNTLHRHDGVCSFRRCRACASLHRQDCIMNFLQSAFWLFSQEEFVRSRQK